MTCLCACLKSHMCRPKKCKWLLQLNFDEKKGHAEVVPHILVNIIVLKERIYDLFMCLP